MSGEDAFKKASELLKKHNQSHLLAFWEQLSRAEKQNLLTQIQQLNFRQIDDWIANIIRKSPSAHAYADIAPAPFYPVADSDTQQQKKYNTAIELGKELISAGKVAAMVVAGGQGTRLGFSGPKGNFPISLIRKKTLFQLFAEYLAAASKKYQTICPWYIMTSPLNHEQTRDIFRSNDYYGLGRENVFIFQQGTLPNFDFDGRILLEDKAKIACSPDGHGGTFKALSRSGALNDMRQRGIEFISYWQVDNSMINILDPLFIGLHALDEAEMSSKGLVKTEPKEKVGNFCLADGKMTIIEYSDLPDELAEKKEPDGSLTFRLGSIGIHIISRSFAEKLGLRDCPLPLHRAKKKIPHIDAHGKRLEPIKPNGVKLESFIFDAVPLASKSIILETVREQEFAPSKNAAGVDSPETASELMLNRAADWLESAGVSIPKKPDGSPDCVIEISPSFALYKGDVTDKLHKIPKIRPNDRIYLE